MKVVIKEQEIELKKTMRSYMMFESITDKAFAPKNLTDMVTYFYCVVMSSCKGFELTFDEFIDWLDEHDGIMPQFTQWLAGVNEIEAGMTKKKEGSEKGQEITFKELFRLVCFEYKVCSIQYFMDEMQPYELYLILENLNYSIKNDWEIGREIMWSNLQPWSKKKLKPEDVISLPWDNKQSKRKANVEVTNEIVAKMKKSAEINKAALVSAGIL